MKSVTILFLTLKGSPAIDIRCKEGNIVPLIYELFSNFDHKIDLKDSSIFLNPIQKNTIELRNSIDVFIGKYSKLFPAIQQFNRVFKLLDENEYFYMIINKKLSVEESYKYYSHLMKLNIPNFDLETNIKQGEELFKGIWDNYEISITRENTRLIIGEKNRSKRICRFCERSMNEGATFKKEAHAISEALGNKNIILAEECDECNEYFGKTIEHDLLTYLSIYRTFFGILNKDNKIPIIKGKNFEYKNLGDKNIMLKIIDDGSIENNNYFDVYSSSFLLKFYEKITEQNIYKVLVKFALSIIDASKLDSFKNTIKWIREENNFKEDLPKIGILASYELFKNKPLLSVYIRKSNNKNIPFAVGEFHFTFLTFVFIIPVFSDDEKEFIFNEEFKTYWEFFRHYDLSKDFKFISFINPNVREVQFNLNFNQNIN